MTALVAERNTSERVGTIEQHPIKANVKIFKGSLCVIDAGYLAPGRSATGLLVAGRAEDTIDNTVGAAGALTVPVKRGKFRWGNSAAGDLIAQANVGALCYIVDDQTVALTDGTGTRSSAGKIVGVDAAGVWVESKLVD